MKLKKLFIAISLIVFGISSSDVLLAKENDNKSNCVYVLNEVTGELSLVCDDSNEDLVEPYILCTPDCWGDD